MRFLVKIRFPSTPILSRNMYEAQICERDPFNTVLVWFGDKWIEMDRRDVQIIKTKSIGELYGTGTRP